MTNTSLQQISTPVVTTPNSKGIVRPKVASPEALEILNLEPVKTVWGRQGRTILERLPKESGTYQLYDAEDASYVYIDPSFGTTFGPGSCEVGFGQNNQAIIAAQDGEIVWKDGAVKVPYLEVDTSTLNNGLGLNDGPYQIGYTLELGPAGESGLIPGYAKIQVEEETLAPAAIGIEANNESQGHSKVFALDSFALKKSWQPNETAQVLDYFPGAWFVIDFKAPIEAEAFELIAEDGSSASALCTAYWSDDAIVWNKQAEVRPNSNKWSLNVRTTKGSHRYWRFFFWDGEVSISDIRFTGSAYYPDNRSVGDIPLATPFIDDVYSEIEGDFILLAHFTVAGGAVSEVVDYRNFINRKYEPVSSWLTTFQDEQLTCLFDDVESYASKFLAPPTADFHLYEELDDNICSGFGELTVGREEDRVDEVFFPSVVELLGSSIVIGNGEQIFIDPQGDPEVGLEVDEGPLAYDNYLIPGGIGIFCSAINLVADPTLDGDLATKASSDETFAKPWSVDDGIY